jgi:CrcB protein
MRRAGFGRRGAGDSRRPHLNRGLLLAVAIGGAAGGAARAAIALALPAARGQFPWAILTINVLGSLLIGALLEMAVLRRPGNARWRALATTGFCGGFTTWSTFMVSADELIAAHRPAVAFGYVALSVVAGLAAVVAGAGAAARVLGPLAPGGEQ